MAKSIKKKENPALSDYPPDILEKIKMPQYSHADGIEWLNYFSKYDTLRSETIHINGYGSIPVYSLEFEYLKQQFPPEEMPLQEYAKGYKEGIKADFIPYIDTPENRKELVIKALECRTGFPTSFHDPKAFYEYGIIIGRQRRAWDIVLETPEYFQYQPGKQFGRNKIEKHPSSSDELNRTQEASGTEQQIESSDPYQFIKDTLKPLSGKWWVSDMQIMTGQEYSRLVNYTVYMIEHKKLPPKSVMITRTGATTEFIRKTYHLLFQHTRKSVPRDLYCQFLQKIFGQFKDLEFKSITQNFARFDGSNYDEIAGVIISKIEK